MSPDGRSPAPPAALHGRRRRPPPVRPRAPLPLAARRALLAFALAAAALAGARPARAQPGAATEPRRTVSVSVTGAPEEARVLEDTIRELLARLQLTMVGREDSRAALLAKADVEIAPSGSARVVVRSATGATVLERDVPRDANAAIQREQIAHAVRVAAEAELLVEHDRVASREPPSDPPAGAPPAGAPPAGATEEAPSPAPPSAAVERDRADAPASALAIELATFGGAGILGDGAGPVARVGGSVALASRRGLRPSLALGALYAFPFTSGSDTLTSRAHLVSARAMPAIELLRGSWIALDVAAGGGFDVLTVEPSSATLPLSALGEKTTRVDPIASASATARVALASDVVLTLSLVADVDPTTRRYVFEDRGARSEVLAPWTVRPTLLAGLSFTAHGEAPFRPERAAP